MRRNTRNTRKIRNTRATWTGKGIIPVGTQHSTTIVKSNTFHPLRKYPPPYAVIFKMASTM